MTREDAIIHLKDLQAKLPETNFLDKCAIDMGIEALEEQRIKKSKQNLKKKHDYDDYPFDPNVIEMGQL